jgi:hypothetical protein
MNALTRVCERADLLGTTWRSRATQEVAVVWSVYGSICLIDVDWEPRGEKIADLRPLNCEPKYWRLQTEEELRREWRQVKAGWIPVGP